MTTVNVAYEVNQTVFHVDNTYGVREGIVKSISINTTVLGTTIRYNVQFVVTSFGSVEADEADLYADVDSALTQYRCRIVGC